MVIFQHGYLLGKKNAYFNGGDNQWKIDSTTITNMWKF